jgi:hypothetical protein
VGLGDLRVVDPTNDIWGDNCGENTDYYHNDHYLDQRKTLLRHNASVCPCFLTH